MIQALIISILNMVRGNGNLSRPIFCLLVACTLSLYNPALDIMILFLGVWFGMVWGYGKYFMAIHGMDMRHEKEFLPADIILSILPLTNNYVYGIVGMSLRFLIGFLPLLGILLYSYGYDYSRFFLLVLVGPAYYIAGRFSQQYGVRIAEGLTGLILGVTFI